MTRVFFKGGIAYECQIGRIWFRWVHLRGKHWRLKPWRRFSMGWDSSVDNGDNGENST